jgi:hypothetical protein
LYDNDYDGDEFNSNDNSNGSICKCIAHRVFGIHMVEQVSSIQDNFHHHIGFKVLCYSCGATTEPIQSSMFTVYTYATALRFG